MSVCGVEWVVQDVRREHQMWGDAKIPLLHAPRRLFHTHTPYTHTTDTPHTPDTHSYIHSDTHRNTHTYTHTHTHTRALSCLLLPSHLAPSPHISSHLGPSGNMREAHSSGNVVLPHDGPCRRGVCCWCVCVCAAPMKC